MARGGTSTGPSHAGELPVKTLVVDAGAYTIKAGFAPTEQSSSPDPVRDCLVIPNCIARSRDKHVYVGSELAKCTDFGEMVFRRPVEKGYIVNWEAESAIWEHEFLMKDAQLHCDPHETNLILTEPSNAPHAIQSNSDQIVFEEFEFASYYRCIGPSLNAWNPTTVLFHDPQSPPPTEIMLLIDSSHSHTTITPLLHGQPIHAAIRRLSLGGKHLTAYLAELISLRHFSLIDEPHIVSQIKEDTCFVSSDFSRDLAAVWTADPQRRRQDPHSDIVLDYVLPDYETTTRGYTRPHDASHAAKMARLGVGVGTAAKQANAATAVNDGAAPAAGREEVFPLANERFVVPELLFNPGDVGMPESGLPDTVMQSLAAVPRALWQGLLGNVVLVGGCSLLPGFVERLEQGVRMLAPAECVVRVRRAEDPIKATWCGGARLASQRHLVKNVLVTRQEYQEYGAAWVARQFASRKIVQ